MGTLIYTAVDRGRLVSGHTAGNIYSIEIDFKTFLENEKRVISETKSISGQVYTQYMRKDTTAKVDSVWTDDATIIAQMDEFIDSVAAGETFDLDPYGTLASPVNTYPAQVEGDIRKSRYRYIEMFSYSFTIRFDPTQVT